MPGTDALFLISIESLYRENMACGNRGNVSGLLLRIGEFGGPESSKRNMDMDTNGATDPPHRREDTRPKQMGRMWGDVPNKDCEIVAGAHVYPNLARSMVASRLQYAGGTYTDWAYTIRRVSIGVVLMVQARAVNIQWGIHFPPTPSKEINIRDRTHERRTSAITAPSSCMEER